MQATLDECQELGMTVTVGIWLGHERHGFNYNNADQVAEQYQRAREAIERFKEHPAVLLWAIGNEMEGYEKGDNAAIWSAINNIASLVRRLDPKHPTMTVVAEIGGERVNSGVTVTSKHEADRFGGDPDSPEEGSELAPELQ